MPMIISCTYLLNTSIKGFCCRFSSRVPKLAMTIYAENDLCFIGYIGWCNTFVASNAAIASQSIREHFYSYVWHLQWFPYKQHLRKTRTQLRRQGQPPLSKTGDPPAPSLRWKRSHQGITNDLTQQLPFLDLVSGINNVTPLTPCGEFVCRARILRTIKCQTSRQPASIQIFFLTGYMFRAWYPESIRAWYPVLQDINSSYMSIDHVLLPQVRSLSCGDAPNAGPHQTQRLVLRSLVVYNLLLYSGETSGKRHLSGARLRIQFTLDPWECQSRS